jgi:glucan phosphoethanolaminetransferase (alkaline phosphatase superfamily)
VFTMAFNIVLQIPRFLEFTLGQSITVSDHRENPTYIILTMVLAIIFLNMLPLTILIFINISLYKTVKARARRLVRLSNRRVRRFF